MHHSLRRLLMVVLTAFCCSASGQTVFVVSPGAAGQRGQFVSPADALAAVAALRKDSATRPGPVVIRIMPGTYVLDQPLAIAGNLSTAAAPLTIDAMPGGPVVFSGGQLLSGWQDSIVNGRPGWSLKVPSELPGLRELWINGRRASRARFPRTGYLAVPVFTPVSPHWQQGQSFLPINPADLPASLSGDVEAIATSTWVESWLPVTKLDVAARRLLFDRLTLHAAAPGDLYWLEGSPAWVTAAGDWCEDRATATVSYLALPGETKQATTAIVPRLDRLLSIGGVAPADAISGLTLRGITFSYAAWNFPPAGASGKHSTATGISGFDQADIGVPAAVVLDRATDCRFEDCRFEHLDTYGLALHRGCQRDVISQCDFNDLGAGGIKIGETGLHPVSQYAEPPPDEAEQTHGNAVVDCRITDGGHTFASAVGIWIGQSYENHLLHNEIADFYYTGISIGWTWGYGTSHAMGNVVEDNLVHHIGVKTNGDGPILSDMGGIYTLGSQPGTIIRGNVFHDIAGLKYGGWGIYMDEGSSGILIENNLVYRTTHGGFHQHYGQDNIVRSNVFALGRDVQIVRTRPEPHNSFTFEHNIVFGDSTPMVQTQSPTGLRFESNLYWRSDGDASSIRFGKLTLAQWQAAGQDLISIVADPHFEEPSRGNFKLSADSPAARIGFAPVDWTKAGPRLRN